MPFKSGYLYLNMFLCGWKDFWTLVL